MLSITLMRRIFPKTRILLDLTKSLPLRTQGAENKTSRYSLGTKITQPTRLTSRSYSEDSSRLRLDRRLTSYQLAGCLFTGTYEHYRRKPDNRKRDKHNACLPKATGPTFTTDGLFAPRYTWTRNQTTASSSRVPGNSTQQRTSIAYPPSIPRIPGSDILNSPTDPKAPVDQRNVVDMDTFRNHAAQTNANMAQMHSRMHLAVSDAPVIDRVIEETKRTPFTERIARFCIRDVRILKIVFGTYRTQHVWGRPLESHSTSEQIPAILRRKFQNNQIKDCEPKRKGSHSSPSQQSVVFP